MGEVDANNDDTTRRSTASCSHVAWVAPTRESRFDASMRDNCGTCAPPQWHWHGLVLPRGTMRGARGCNTATPRPIQSPLPARLIARPAHLPRAIDSTTLAAAAETAALRMMCAARIRRAPGLPGLRGASVRTPWLRAGLGRAIDVCCVIVPGPLRWREGGRARSCTAGGACEFSVVRSACVPQP